VLCPCDVIAKAAGTAPAELSKLRQTGRDHPVVVVDVLPQDVTPDIDVAHVEIDVGDPGE
jgi:hypothetical protein